MVPPRNKDMSERGGLGSIRQTCPHGSVLDRLTIDPANDRAYRQPRFLASRDRRLCVTASRRVCSSLARVRLRRPAGRLRPFSWKTSAVERALAHIANVSTPRRALLTTVLAGASRMDTIRQQSRERLRRGAQSRGAKLPGTERSRPLFS